VTEGASVANLCRGGARRASERNAIEWDGGEVTFEALDRRTEALARHFQETVEPGRRVGIYCENRVEWVEAYVAAHKAGIPVVPINHRYRRREVEHILGEANLDLVVRDDTAHDDLEVQELLAGVNTLDVGDAFERAAGRPAALIEPRETTEDVIVYTSGTTALPKGVVYTRSTQVTSVWVLQLAIGYDPSDRFLIFTPLAHRAAQPLLLCALFQGATTYLLGQYSAAGLATAVRDRRVTSLPGVPTALRDLLGLVREAKVEPMTGVRHVLMTGESVGDATLREIRDLFPNARFGAAYGSTEAGLVTFLDHEHQLEHPRSCGRELQGVEVRLVGDDGLDVPVGEPGEIVVRGGKPGTYTVAAGYLAPGGGIESFTDEDGWFQTGDVATVDHDGFYTIVDRKKDMILSGGMNIASKEVEEIVATHPGVAEVAVTGEPDARFGERVVAWVVRRPDATVGEEEIVSHVATRAASYKKPSVVRFVDGLPRSPTGKVLKQALKADASEKTGV